MKALLIRAYWALAYRLFCLLDHGIWLLIQLLPGPTLIGLARQRPWQIWQLRLAPAQQQRWRNRMARLMRSRCWRAGWGSTCLSRSISGRILLDLIGVSNELHLGMSKFPDGRKVPHAWLRDPHTGQLYTPGLNPGAGAPLTHF
jgi:hypothetical protein